MQFIHFLLLPTITHFRYPASCCAPQTTFYTKQISKLTFNQTLAQLAGALAAVFAALASIMNKLEKMFYDETGTLLVFLEVVGVECWASNADGHDVASYETPRFFTLHCFSSSPHHFGGVVLCLGRTQANR